MISAKQRAALYDHRYQFADAIVLGTRTRGIAWLPGAFFPSATERCIYSDKPIVIIDRPTMHHIGTVVTRTITRMMEVDRGNS